MSASERPSGSPSCMSRRGARRGTRGDLALAGARRSHCLPPQLTPTRRHESGGAKPPTGRSTPAKVAKMQVQVATRQRIYTQAPEAFDRTHEPRN